MRTTDDSGIAECNGQLACDDLTDPGLRLGSLFPKPQMLIAGLSLLHCLNLGLGDCPGPTPPKMNLELLS